MKHRYAWPAIVLLLLLAAACRDEAPAGDKGGDATAPPAPAAPGDSTAAAPGDSTPAAPSAVRAEDLMEHVRALADDSMQGRKIGTPGNAKAREYLAREFAEAGLRPVAGGNGFVHPFQVRAGDKGAEFRGANVLGVVRGTRDPNRYIVVTAHYDHLGVDDGQVFNGADDNASGAGALPVLAAWFRANPPEHSILFAALDGEEGPMAGARALVGTPPVPAEAIALNVNLDMVGRNERGELYAAGTHHYPYLKAYLDSVAARAPIKLRFGHDRPEDGPNDWTTQSDHGVFHAAGIPFVYFGVEDHPDYHKPSDDPDRLIPTFYAGAVQTILDALRTLDRNLQAVSAARSAPRASASPDAPPSAEPTAPPEAFGLRQAMPWVLVK